MGVWGSIPAQHLLYPSLCEDLTGLETRRTCRHTIHDYERIRSRNMCKTIVTERKQYQYY
jgi:hypothetical protein